MTGDTYKALSIETEENLVYLKRAMVDVPVGILLRRPPVALRGYTHKELATSSSHSSAGMLTDNQLFTC